MEQRLSTLKQELTDKCQLFRRDEQALKAHKGAFAGAKAKTERKLEARRLKMEAHEAAMSDKWAAKQRQIRGDIKK